MGRGLGIFPARQKTPFVPGESTTRDKRGFCPGWWLHPGQKAPHITSSLALPLTLGFSSICAWCRRRPLLPPPREPSTAAAIDVAAAQSPDQPTGDPPEHRRRRNALAGAAIPCSPSTRRYRPSQPTPRLPKGRARSPESPRHLLHSIEPQNLSLRWEAPRGEARADRRGVHQYFISSTRIFKIFEHYFITNFGYFSVLNERMQKS